tara:strand:- start:301 stop:591 length:291 start_codon:yes stop_codon:yes gene_type:complete
MGSKVHYEWDIETLDEHGDITHDHWDKLRQAPKPQELEENQRVVLVRDVWVDESLEDRQWCYPHLFTKFFDASGEPTGKRMPLRFLKEYVRWEHQA